MPDEPQQKTTQTETHWPLTLSMCSATLVILMIVGYSVIAVPTGIVSAEVASARRPREKSCHNCGSALHAETARFCDACGFALPD